MKKLITILLVFLILTGCSGSGKGNEKPEKKSLTFEAYINEGETFEFTLNPDEAVTYQQLRDGVIERDIDSSCWRSYFDIKEVYREHYEYDDKGNKTDTYSKGNLIMTVLNDEYVYVDNWSRNGLEWEILIEGQQIMTMTNNGKTGNPSVTNYMDVLSQSGADAILILTDFVDSWDELTQQKYEGSLKSYEMVSCKGHVKLLDSSLIQYKHLKDNIYYFAAYESDESFFVVFVESDSADIQRENEYNAIIYEAGSNGEAQRGLGYINLPIWQAYIELMKQVDNS